MVLETERLCLRKLTQADYKDLCSLLQDQEVVYAYEHTFTPSDVQEWLERQLLRYDRDGFGLWAVVIRDTGEMIGQAGLTLQNCDGEQVLEVGYLLKRRFWHRGYAVEAAKGFVEYAFETLGATKVYAIIKADNLPSQKVAQRIGMTREKSFITQYYHGDMLHHLYSVLRTPGD